MAVRGYSRGPGLVKGEPCTVTVLRLPAGKDYTGPPVPEELFEQEWIGEVFEVGARCEDGWTATVRLTDPRLEKHPERRLSRLFGGEPPGPFRYQVQPVSYLLGETRDADFHTGDVCYIWVKTRVPLPWAPGEAEKPSATQAPVELEGFHHARILAITKVDESGVRRVRAVFTDSRISSHRFAHVRAFHGREPTTSYRITRTNDALTESWDTFAASARTLGKKATGWLESLSDRWD